MSRILCGQLKQKQETVSLSGEAVCLVHKHPFFFKLLEVAQYHQTKGGCE
jgi:hypothetical protein